MQKATLNGNMSVLVLKEDQTTREMIFLFGPKKQDHPESWTVCRERRYAQDPYRRMHACSSSRRFQISTKTRAVGCAVEHNHMAFRGKPPKGCRRSKTKVAKSVVLCGWPQPDLSWISPRVEMSIIENHSYQTRTLIELNQTRSFEFWGLVRLQVHKDYQIHQDCHDLINSCWVQSSGHTFQCPITFILTTIYIPSTAFAYTMPIHITHDNAWMQFHLFSDLRMFILHRYRFWNNIYKIRHMPPSDIVLLELKSLGGASTCAILS